MNPNIMMQWKDAEKFERKVRTLQKEVGQKAAFKLLMQPHRSRAELISLIDFKLTEIYIENIGLYGI